MANESREAARTYAEVQRNDAVAMCKTTEEERVAACEFVALLHVGKRRVSHVAKLHSYGFDRLLCLSGGLVQADLIGLDE